MFENRADLTKQLSLTACYGLCLPLYDIQSRIINLLNELHRFDFFTKTNLTYSSISSIVVTFDSILHIVQTVLMNIY